MCSPMKNSLGRDGIKELVKVVVSAKDDKVLGFHMVGSEASEIMQVRSILSNAFFSLLSGQYGCPMSGMNFWDNHAWILV